MDRMSSTPNRNSARRYLAIWLRFWAADRWRRAHATADGQGSRPFVLVETVGPRREVRAADPRALACGVAPGQGVADAQTLVPDLLVLPADPAGDLAALHRLAEWATRFSPLVAPDPGDGLMLDITGCAHLWGPGDNGEEKLLADVLHRLRSHGFDVSGAIAGTIGAAWAAARFSQSRQGTIIPAGAVSG